MPSILKIIRDFLICVITIPVGAILFVLVVFFSILRFFIQLAIEVFSDTINALFNGQKHD